MLKNSHTHLLRQLRKNKGYAAINIFGLGLGMACCVFILLFVQHERSFDRFHDHADDLYRVNKVVTPQEGGTEQHAITGGMLAPAMTEAFPEVAEAVRVLPWFSEVLLVHEDQAISSPEVVFADAQFFDVFSFGLRRGDPATALAAPMSMVLTETTAQRLFGEADPLGQIVRGLNNLNYTVTGIAADPPQQSHLKFEALVSWASSLPGEGRLNFGFMNRWITQVAYTYVQLAPDADVAALEAKLPAFYQQRDPDRAAQYHLFLQPLSDVYLKSTDLLHTRQTRQGNIRYVYFFSVMALLILAIAVINFVNLTTAQATRRAKEVGVRKALGARRPQLTAQFLAESVGYSLLALVFALVVISLSMPAFQALTGKPIGFSLWQQPGWVLAMLAGTVVVGLVAGIYPALILSGFNPISALKGSVARRSLTPRRALVTFQFAISIVLVAATLVVIQQMSLLQNRDLGFAQEQLLVLPIHNTGMQQQYAAFKEEVERHPTVVKSAGSNAVPGSGTSTFGIAPEGAAEGDQWLAHVVRIDDYDLADTYDFDLVAGRYFSPDQPTDMAAGVVINETLARQLGWTEPVGKRLDIPGEISPATVIGVVKDFHFQSLHHAIEPLVFYAAPRRQNLSVRVSLDDLPATLAHLQTTWERFEDTYPFTYTFLDQQFAQFYTSEQQLLRTVGVFAALAIVIACLGLFGLAAFMAAQRTKEIGVRKVLGATTWQVMMLFLKEYALLVLLALLAAAPLAYLAADRWLQDFAYRIDLGPGVFLLAGGATLLVALLTVGYQSLRAALADPVRALRYE